MRVKHSWVKPAVKIRSPGRTWALSISKNIFHTPVPTVNPLSCEGFSKIAKMGEQRGYQFRILELEDSKELLLEPLSSQADWKASHCSSQGQVQELTVHPPSSPNILPQQQGHANNSKAACRRQGPSHSTALHWLSFKLRIESTLLEKAHEELTTCRPRPLLLQPCLEPHSCPPSPSLLVFIHVLEQAKPSPISGALHLRDPPPGSSPLFM